MDIKAKISVVTKIGFASHQNAVPLLRELSLYNESDKTYQDLTLSLTASPEIIESKNWKIDRLLPESVVHIHEQDRDLKLNAEWLANLTESVQGELILHLTQGNETLLSSHCPLEILARNEWGGSPMVELLPAFVMPNDPAVDRLIKTTSDVLRRAGKNDQLDGYTSQSRSRIWELCSALWTAVCNLRLSYALPPASFESEGQKVRTPTAIFDGLVATCIDTSLLFASALEQLRLNPLLILIKGHAFVGLWLQPQEFSQLLTEDVSAIRKRIDLNEMLVFETTLATSAQPVSFSQAVENASRSLTDEDFLVAIDVQRARMQKIKPLSSKSLPCKSGIEETESENVLNAFEEAPLLPSFDVEVSDAPENDKVNRLEHWRRKLLDLTTRNRLLHLPNGSKSIRLICSDPAKLEDKLAEGKRIRIVPLPDLESNGRDALLYEQQNHENLYEEYSRQALERNEVVSLTEQSRLDALLVELYRKSKNDLEEGGANTLFLAVGFLKWKKKADDPKTYSAPLILLPVQLDRKSVVTGITMRLLEEEPRFNLTLLELLRNDFALTINGLDGALPVDESGINVNGIWDIVRRAVRDMPGFEVTRDVAIGTFSFAKYLMWKDLSDRSEQLMQSPLVKYLLERGQKDVDLPVNGNFIGTKELDSNIKVNDLFLPLPADSSQIAAIVASAKGRDFVLDGPPGTGKSQTIANMISHNLALGRRVLFVAGKKAALDVVYRRLESKGLGEFCLELHSNKTSKLDFLKQLERAWDTRDAMSATEWKEETLKVQHLRDKLNEVVELLHRRWPNGLTLYQAIGRVIKEAGKATPQLTWSAGIKHSAEQMAQFRDIVRRLELNKDIVSQHGLYFALINQSDWTNGWQSAIFSAARQILPAIDSIDKASKALLDVVPIPCDSDNTQNLQEVVEFCELLATTSGSNFSFMFECNVVDRIEAGTRVLGLLAEIVELEQKLSVIYPENSWEQVDIRGVEIALADAAKKFWFFADFARKKVIDTVVHRALLAKTPNLDIDIPLIKKLQEKTSQLKELSELLTGFPGWNGLSTDKVKLEKTITVAKEIRNRMLRFVSFPQQLAEVRKTVRTLLIEANDLLNDQGLVRSLTYNLKRTLLSFNTLEKEFLTLLGQSKSPSSRQSLYKCAEEIINNQSSLKAWCDWYRVSEEAMALGLEPIVEILAQQCNDDLIIAEIFETAYCRWFASWVIDSEPVLHNFVPAEHMSDIEIYRQQIDKLSALSVRYIRARLCEMIPAKKDISKQGGLALLKHELQKSRRHKPVRQMVYEMGDTMSKLAPCMLMSPLSVAQFLPAELALFDLVIFDEASQIAPWDAIGVIARGKQVVVAGDPRQMPPTSFFDRGAGDVDDDTEEDMESILDECLAAGMYNHSLNWHYRSRHESLITFSNRRYYDSNLITFPAAKKKNSAVEWRNVKGIYARGKGRHNQIEAESMVSETMKRLLDKHSSKSIGIITLNVEQQKLVNDLLDRERQRHPEIETFFQQEQEEPVVVKNLETVQGDERDVIMLGIGFGPTEAESKTMSMDFGPLNRDGGWRRLNVAVTRARQEMLVFSSFDSSMIDLNRTHARAVADLKLFIEFARRGPLALAQEVRGSVGTYDSPFEEAVADGLRRKGWEVVPQIGVSRFRIDLGIVHPDRPGDYLVGIECDGATYHSAATARDRDKVRSVILESLGWKLLRLWSTEWWIDKESALERLHNAIDEILENSRKEDKLKISCLPEPEFITSVIGVKQNLDIPKNSLLLHTVNHDSQSEVKHDVSEKHDSLIQFASSESASNNPEPSLPGKYQVSDFDKWCLKSDPSLFYTPTPEYEQFLKEFVHEILIAEAPILDATLFQRMAKVHGFNKAGRVIRERVLKIVHQYYYLGEDKAGGNFVWLSEAQRLNWNTYRLPVSENDIRMVDTIASEELQALSTFVKSEDKISEMIKILGIKRVTSQARKRLESIL
ncbi:DNA helicase [Oxalobacter formigenes OXCC13]|nr:DNA helicase [Oxalobacter formigenes OXCC13]QDX34142.1 DUF3320 domain-containing protein [Oxalobacter formigenes]